MEHVDAADADGADGVAVIGVFQGDEPALFRPAEMLPVLKSHLDADLDGGRAVIGVKDLAEPFRSDLDKSFGEQRRLLAGKAEQGRVFDLVQLPLDSLIDGGVTVTVHIGPEVGNAIEIAVAVAVDQPAAFTAGQLPDECRLPLLHLGEGVPDIAAVILLQQCRCQCHSQPISRSRMRVSGWVASQAASAATTDFLIA